MDLQTPTFTFDYQPGAIHFGRGCISRLSEHLDAMGFDQALVVCGSNVGSNPAVMTPLRDGLDDHLAGVFAETTSKKSIETAYEGVTHVGEDIDVIIGLGGGSSLDIATVMTVLASDFRPLPQIREEVKATGRVELRDGHDPLPGLIMVPTTFAGADLSVGAGINVPTPTGQPLAASVIDPDLMPDAMFYDPNLFETTPNHLLAGSAMNGFDKGIEAIYSRYSNPLTDATAVRGLRYLTTALPQLHDENHDTMERIVAGMVLVQYGVSTPDTMKLAILHAFGHAFRDCGVYQGTGHAVIAPHALRYVFENVDARRASLATAFGVEAAPDKAAAVVDAVTDIRDSLELPTRIRDIEGIARSDLPDLANRALTDHCMENSPAELDPSLEELTTVLENAW